MSVFKCKMCGGDLAFEEGSTVCECEYCGSKQTLPNADSEKKVNLYNRANRLRRNNEFDKASAVYESIVAEFPEEAEAYWGLCLCAYGIEYVDDPATGSKIPTCHRTLTASIMEDSNFEQACDNSDAIARRVYRDEAKAIDRIQKDILSIAANESPYDVFICYKETNDAGSRTEDSVLGQEIYDALTAKNLKVFFSRITLEDKLGVQYEPYIYAALSSARVMIAVGTDFEYYDAVWVKNEWSRFLGMMKTDKTKTLIPCFKGIDAYDIPKEFKGLQAQDMSKLGWLQDLTRGVEKLCGKSSDTQTAAAIQQVVTASSVGGASFLERAFIFLEDNDWESAEEYCEKVLDLDPRNAQAYLGKLMAELHVSTSEEFKSCEMPFDDNDNYHKIMRFGDAALKEELETDIQFIKDRNENARLTKLYEDAVQVMNSAKTEIEYSQVAEQFASISNFKDAAELEKQCLDKCKEIKAQLEKNVDEALQLADIVIALRESKSGESLQTLQQKFEELGNLSTQFPSIIAEQSNLQSQKDAVEGELFMLRDTRAKLGLFAGKEKKATDAKIVEKESELASLNSRMAECQTRLGGYSSIEEINEQIENLKQSIDARKTAEKSEGTLSSEEAVKRLCELCAFPNVRKAATKRNPKIKTEISLFAEIGDNINFGSYPSEEDAQSKPIEWIVLERQCNKLLMISKYGLNAKRYNDELKDVTWETCTLRSWLNDDFYNAAFSDDEKNVIVQTEVSADKNPKYSTNPGNSTSDNVFLLSKTEAEKYFTDDNARMCAPTAYAIAQGAWTSDKYKTTSGEATCWWWLRSPGCYRNYAAHVYCGGSVDYVGIAVSSDNGCVRPALWINLAS